MCEEGGRSAFVLSPQRLCYGRDLVLSYRAIRSTYPDRFLGQSKNSSCAFANAKEVPSASPAYSGEARPPFHKGGGRPPDEEASKALLLGNWAYRTALRLGQLLKGWCCFSNRTGASVWHVRGLYPRTKLTPEEVMDVTEPSS